MKKLSNIILSFRFQCCKTNFIEKKEMKLLDRIWLPITGSLTSIGFKGIETSTNLEVPILQIPVVQDHSLWYYLLVGMFGALGGLMVKVIWSALKRWFPKQLKHLDQ